MMPRVFYPELLGDTENTIYDTLPKKLICKRENGSAASHIPRP